MVTMTEAEKLARLDKDLASIRTKLNKRRAELRAEDLERRKREFDKLPLKQRKIREMIGWSPYQNEAQIRRISGTIATK